MRLIRALVIIMIREKMYVALSATNEAILRTVVQEDLFRRVCDAAVESGFKSAGTLLPGPGGWLHVVAAAGTDRTKPLPELKISTEKRSRSRPGRNGLPKRPHMHHQ
jgi:hypothetical protein